MEIADKNDKWPHPHANIDYASDLLLPTQAFS